jgi:hypothetical protein
MITVPQTAYAEGPRTKDLLKVPAQRADNPSMNLTLALEAAGPFDPRAITRREARARANAWYRANGRQHAPRLLSATGKMLKSATPTVGIILRPGNASGLEACTWRTRGCTAVCVLEESFRGRDAGNRHARDLRTYFLAEDPQAFVTVVYWELVDLRDKYGRVLFRPNVASDLRWERIAPALFRIPRVNAYDYTKADPMRHRDRIRNYRLVYSVSELPRSEEVALEYMRAGGTAAVVLDARRHALPRTWRGMRVVDGDLGDDRTRDPRGVVVGLAVKANGRTDTTGFVKRLELTVV